MCKTKLNLLRETNNMPKTTALSKSLSFISNKHFDAKKTTKKLNTSHQSYYGGQKQKNDDENVFN